jgi:hypothetical protein
VLPVLTMRLLSTERLGYVSRVTQLTAGAGIWGQVVAPSLLWLCPGQPLPWQLRGSRNLSHWSHIVRRATAAALGSGLVAGPLGTSVPGFQSHVGRGYAATGTTKGQW